jgi:hypothetical protein
VVASPPQTSFIKLNAPKASVSNMEDKISFIFNVVNAASGFEELKGIVSTL